MAEHSIWTDISLELGEELAALRKQKSKAVPFGEERVTPSVLRKRLMESESLRRKVLAEPGGREKILRLLRDATI